MVDSIFTSYKIEERSYVSLVKRDIHSLLKQAGFPEVRVAEINIVVSELTSNLIKHANCGELLYRIAFENKEQVFEIICMDKGPGVNDINRLMEDGISSANTLGHGLGAINRLADFFQIYSRADSGTVAYAKCYLKKLDTKPISFYGIQTGAINVPHKGEVVSGDSYYIKKTKYETQLLLIDALGHGKHANETAIVALKAFEVCEENDPAEIFRFIHTQTKKTRGLVGGLAILNHVDKTWKISGIGNISTVMMQNELKRYNPHNGIIGHNIPRVITHHESTASSNDWIVMCSDGVQNRWDFIKYPFVQNYHPVIIASVIYRDYGRRTDDTTILVGKINI